MPFTTVIVAEADSTLAVKFLAPLAACQAAAHYRDNGLRSLFFVCGGFSHLFFVPRRGVSGCV